jgi:hypothetical protein
VPPAPGCRRGLYLLPVDPQIRLRSMRGQVWECLKHGWRCDGSQPTPGCRDRDTGYRDRPRGTRILYTTTSMGWSRPPMEEQVESANSNVGRGVSLAIDPPERSTIFAPGCTRPEVGYSVVGSSSTDGGTSWSASFIGQARPRFHAGHRPAELEHRCA